MILVDTSVWTDHLHGTEPRLVSLLHNDLVITHEGVVGELALGSIHDRARVIGLIQALTHAPTLQHHELLSFIEQAQLWGNGSSLIDVQVLGAARLAGAAIWTRDKRLRVAADHLGVATFEEATA